MLNEPSVEQLKSRIAAALAPFSDVRVAYVFGSRARGSARPDSDLDLALAFRRELEPSARGELVLRVIAALTAAIGTLGERADVVDLERAGSALGFRVIRDGKLVLCRDPGERVRLEAAIARRYDDDRPHRELFRRAARAAAERMSTGRG